MGKVQWSDAMRVGVVEIDDQHEGLTTVINTLYDAYMPLHNPASPYNFKGLHMHSSTKNT